MSESEPKLKAHHSFLDYLYWNLFVAVPIVTACVAIIKHSVIWLIVYIIACILLVGLIYRFCCTHCPHYIDGGKTVNCMFFRALPKFFDSRPGPLSFFEKTVTIMTPILIILLPFYWLRLHIGLLVIYLLSFAVLILTIRRNECGRCIHLHCPANCVPEEIKRQ